MIFQINESPYLLKNSDSLFKRMAVLGLTIIVWWLSERYLRPFCGEALLNLKKTAGDGPFIQHLISQSLPVDLTCLVLFFIFYKLKMIPAPRFAGRTSVIFREGLLWGLLICLPTIPLALQFGYHLGFAPNWGSIVGNIFSNFYEEFTYRFFLFSVAAYAFRNIWAGLLTSALLFAIVHSQYPLSMQLIVGLAGIFFSMAYLRSGSILSALLAHQLSDMILDSILVR